MGDEEENEVQYWTLLRVTVSLSKRHFVRFVSYLSCRSIHSDAHLSNRIESMITMFFFFFFFLSFSMVPVLHFSLRSIRLSDSDTEQKKGKYDLLKQ